MSIAEIGEIYKEGEYYVQKFNVTGNTEISSYTIAAIANMPNGTIITNANGIQTTVFNKGELFFVKIPKNAGVFCNNMSKGTCKLFKMLI